MRLSSHLRTPAHLVLLTLGLIGRTELSLAADPKPEPPIEVTTGGWLKWSAPPECPTSEDIEAQVRAWIHTDPPPPGGLRVEATVTSSAAAWTVHVVVHDGDTHGERLVSTATCSDAAELVAIAAALAIAPDEGSIPRPKQPSPPSSSPQELPTSATRSPETGLRAQGVPRPPSAKPVLQGHGRVGWFLGAGALLSSGLLPGFRAGLEVNGGIRLGRLEVALSGVGFPSAAVAVPGGAAPVDLAALGGGASFAYLLGGRGLSFGPAFGLEAGAILADQKGEGPARSATGTPWFALLTGARVRLRLSQSLRAALGADFFLPLARPDLVLDDGAPVHRVDLGVRGMIEVCFQSERAE